MRGALLHDGVVWLRPMTLDDVDEWLAGEDEEQVRWFEFPRPAARDDVVRAITDWMEAWRTGGPVRQWAICDGAGVILGGVDIRDLGGGEVNVSYVVFPAARRQGHASRAVRLAVEYARVHMDARMAVFKVLVGNVASLGVAEGLGAVRVRTEPSESGATFVILNIALGDVSDP